VVQALFDSKNMIQPVHRASEDVKQHPEGRKARQVKYCGPIADCLSLEELLSAASVMDEIRAVGAEVIRAVPALVICGDSSCTTEGRYARLLWRSVSVALLRSGPALVHT
jgi:hypothetical protein